MDFSKLTGYEFEDLIAQMFKEKGFEVEQTDYSGDGGVDIIVTYKEPLHFGKYIVQCKNYSGLVGQPELRDLYGVVMSENANKGILITPSDFSEQAYAFASGKQLELINGTILRMLLGDGDSAFQLEEIFYHKEGFNSDRYFSLKRGIEGNPTDAYQYSQMYYFLRSYIVENSVAICKAGLFTEIIGLVKQWEKRCYRGKSKQADQQRKKCNLLLADTYLVMGEVAQAAEILLDLGESFYQFEEYEPFWPYAIVFGRNDERVTYSEQDVNRRAGHSIIWNLYAVFKSIGYLKGLSLVTEHLVQIQNVNDYIKKADSITVNYCGIDNAIHIPKHNSVFAQKYTDYDGLEAGIQRNYEWFQKFDQGLLDDRFIFFSTINCGSKAPYSLWENIKDCSRAEGKLTDIRDSYWTKTNEELCKELDQVFLNHGLI